MLAGPAASVVLWLLAEHVADARTANRAVLLFCFLPRPSCCPWSTARRCSSCSSGSACSPSSASAGWSPGCGGPGRAGAAHRPGAHPLLRVGGRGRDPAPRLLEAGDRAAAGAGRHAGLLRLSPDAHRRLARLRPCHPARLRPGRRPRRLDPAQPAAGLQRAPVRPVHRDARGHRGRRGFGRVPAGPLAAAGAGPRLCRRDGRDRPAEQQHHLPAALPAGRLPGAHPGGPAALRRHLPDRGGDHGDAHGHPVLDHQPGGLAGAAAGGLRWRPGGPAAGGRGTRPRSPGCWPPRR
jgi:hypothetical protein